MPAKLADFESDLVQRTASRIVGSADTIEGKFNRLLTYVRDDILFGFPVGGDLTKASETIKLGLGQCNTKATLLLALCKATDIPARIHFSLISKDIQRGFFTGISYRLMPDEISHSWLEIKIDGEWKRTDGFINDASLQASSERELKRRGWTTGLSVALSSPGKDCRTCSTFGTFQQMAAVTDDHGVFDEPADYFHGELYKNRPGPLKLLIYRMQIAAINRRVEFAGNG
ncbi:MAG: transglutaminase family protein [Pseudomonadota bacterium]